MVRGGGPPPTKTLLKSEETTCIAITCCIFHRGVYRGVRGAKPPNTQTSLPNIVNPTASHSLKSDLDSRLAYPRPRPRPILAYPRPRPRLSSFKTKTKTKTSMSKTETETQDLQDQYWKSMTGMNCEKQKVMASRKSSIPVVAHSKQKTSYYV